MKYYPGDIIEIINLTSSECQKIEQETKTYIHDMDKKIIGMRYKIVDCFWAEYGKHFSIEVSGFEFHRPFDTFNVSQVRLYHRPFKNRIKAIIDKIK
jgi:hypothetical protein